MRRSYRRFRPAAVAIGSAAMAGACATQPAPYGPQVSNRDAGYLVQPIETNRFRVSYLASDAALARQYALRRAAEVTLEQGGDWFQITQRYAEADLPRGSRTGVSVGGSVGSGSRGGFSGGGVGIGIGIPLGGGSSKKVSENLEIITGTGPKPDGASFYDARSVLENMPS